MGFHSWGSAVSLEIKYQISASTSSRVQRRGNPFLRDPRESIPESSIFSAIEDHWVLVVTSAGLPCHLLPTMIGDDAVIDNVISAEKSADRYPFISRPA